MVHGTWFRARSGRRKMHGRLVPLSRKGAKGNTRRAGAAVECIGVLLVCRCALGVACLAPHAVSGRVVVCLLRMQVLTFLGLVEAQSALVRCAGPRAR